MCQPICMVYSRIIPVKYILVRAAVTIHAATVGPSDQGRFRLISLNTWNKSRLSTRHPCPSIAGLQKPVASRALTKGTSRGSILYWSSISLASEQRMVFSLFFISGPTGAHPNVSHVKDASACTLFWKIERCCCERCRSETPPGSCNCCIAGMF